jgi:hypothetical protein
MSLSGYSCTVIHNLVGNMYSGLHRLCSSGYIGYKVSYILRVHVWYDRKPCTFGMNPLNNTRVSRLLDRMIYIYIYVCVLFFH